MGMSEAVHWSEGLFLQPHHFQAFARSINGRFLAELERSWAYPYGMLASSLSADALENNFVQFDRLSVMMPSGVIVDVPGTADVPALNIKEALAATSGPIDIHLGVPLWYKNRANTVENTGDDDWRVKRLYRVAEVECEDENTGENPQPMQMRRINARLLLPDDDHTDLETIPVARIMQGVGEDVGLPRQDPSFVPPCMVLGGSPTLREQMRDLANQVEASRAELVTQMTRGGFNVDSMRGVQFEQMLRLRTLNRFSGSLPSLVSTKGVSPFVVYLQLRELLGELSALRPDNDQFEVARYEHDNPAVSFQTLSQRIRSLLRGAVAASYLKAEFVEADGILVAGLEEAHIEGPSDYYLGIKTAQDPTVLAKLVEDQDKFKLMARSMSQRRIWGVKLVEERHPPFELPAESSLHYFRLMRADSMRMWERVKQERELAIVCRDLSPAEYKAALYMTVAGS